MSLNQRITHYTNQQKKQGLLRTRKMIDCPSKRVIRFDSNDYLSLTQEKKIAQAYEHAYAHYPIGSGGSIVLSGYHANHQALEQQFAKLLKVDDCLIFSSGYVANLAVTILLRELNAHSIIDKSIHASFYDGLKLSNISYTRYRHNDLMHLQEIVDGQTDPSLIITEGVFSMTGQLAPLSLMNSLDIPILVDEAHSFGVMGEHGLGATVFNRLTQEEVPLRIIPFGKACAAQGAIIAGKGEWIEALLQASRPLIYSTAISPAQAYGLLKTVDFILDAEDRRTRLFEHINFFKEQIAQSPLQWRTSDSAIQLLTLGCPQLALSYAKQLLQAGFSCSAIRSPTVPTKYSGLRMVLNYQHTPEQINVLFNTLHTVYDHQSHSLR